MYRFLITLVLSAFAIIHADSQATRFFAKADAEELIEGSYVTVEFILENGNGNSFTPPDFSGFQVVSGPARSSSFRSINGNVSRSMSFSYTLVPEKTGSLVIGPASISSNGRRYSTKPLTLKVVEQGEIDPSEIRDIFIETTLSDSSAYIGQQILLEYKLYTRLDVRTVNFAGEQDIDGFYTVPLQNRRSDFSREIINGVEYYTKIIRRVAMFPQQTGTYKIDPVNVSLGISTGQGSGFFFSAQLERKNISARGIEIKVSALPQSAPLSFSGAVGQYTMNLRYSDRNLSTDDAITLLMEINGNGDNKTVRAPEWKTTEDLEIYDPNLVKDNVIPNTSGLRHSKIFEFLIVPLKPGNYILKPEFTYFDPDSNRYITLSQTAGPFKVQAGTGKVSDAVSSEVQMPAAIYTSTSLEPSAGSGNLKAFFLLPLLGLFLLAVGIFAYKYYRRLTGESSREKLLRRQALAHAEKRLDKARQFLDNGNTSAFYEELILSLKNYLDERHKIRALHITRGETIAGVRQVAGQGPASELKTILDQSELALYAPSGPTEPETIYRKTRDLISKLEDHN